MQKDARIAIHRGKIVIYYTKHPLDFRHSTGIHEKFLGKKGYVEKYKPLLDKANKLISEYFDLHKSYPSVEWLRAEFYNEKPVNAATILGLFNDFKIKKTKARKLADQSLKDYTNLNTALEDFSATNNTTLHVKDIDEPFFENFELHLRSKRGLNNNTIRKRIILLRSFCRWVEKTTGYEFDKEIYRFELPEESDVFYVTLSLEELTIISKLELSGLKDEVRDLFIFQNMTGLRYSDSQRITKNFISEGCLKMNSQKTDELMVIPLNRTSRRILEKYDYQLPSISNQVMNKYLKHILKNVPEFKVAVSMPTITRIKKDGTPWQKWELISCHTARRSFITNLIQQKEDLTNIAEKTGHQKMDILLGYWERNKKPVVAGINAIDIENPDRPDYSK
jgi:site-specific recombinase XerD